MCRQGLLTKPCPRQDRDLDRQTPRPTISRSTFGQRGAQTQQAEPQLRATPSRGHHGVQRGFLTEGAEVPGGLDVGTWSASEAPWQEAHILCAGAGGVRRPEAGEGRGRTRVPPSCPPGSGSGWVPPFHAAAKRNVSRRGSESEPRADSCPPPGHRPPHPTQIPQELDGTLRVSRPGHANALVSIQRVPRRTPG